MAYNPFNAASGIVDYKRKWANAKAKGEDTTPYEEGAAAYYQELRNNGRGDVADYLQKSDSITAGEYLKQLQPEYGVDAASLQKKSDNLYGVGVGTMDDISKTFDKVYDNNINVDPTSTGYGKNILSGYGIAADEAYKGTLGGNAEDNGGNVDSFAAANANRQKAAVLSQGYGDVLGYYNAIAGQANQHAVNKGNTVGAYLAQLQGNIDSDRDVTKKAFEGTVDLWKTQDTNKTEKEIAELGADVTREQMAQEKLIADEKNATEVYLQQLKNDAKGGSGGISPVFDAGSVVDNIIKKHTKDSFALSEDTKDGKKFVKNGSDVDWSFVGSDLQAMINDMSIPYDQRVAIYNDARLKGIAVNTPKEKQEETSPVYGDITPEPIVSKTHLNAIDEGMKNKHTTPEKVDYLLNVANNLKLRDENIVWLLNRYNINID